MPLPSPPPVSVSPEPSGEQSNKADYGPKDNKPPVESSCIQVYIRVRPINAKELRSQCLRHFHHEGDREAIQCYDGETLTAKDPSAPRMYASRGPTERLFRFDTVFDVHVTTDQVYQRAARELVDRVLDGYNSTCFAYGQTGAGKTHTMMGHLGIDAGVLGDFTPGVYTLAAEDIFAGVAKRSGETGCSYDITVSFLEIYNESIQDLLQPGKKGRLSSIMEDPMKGVFVPGLSEHSIMRVSDLHDVIRLGNGRRKMAPTGGNEVSSRSHAILQMSLTRHDQDGEIHTSKFSLIDLAGSERAKATDVGARGTRMQEHASINRSLLALANVINILSDSRKKGSFVPYRDSKLTRLLKDSLGGNTKTVMIANVSPACMTYDETLNTLKYASRARNIQAKLQRNTLSSAHHIGEYKRIIQSLRAEVLQLREQLAGGATAGHVMPSDYQTSRAVERAVAPSASRGVTAVAITRSNGARTVDEATSPHSPNPPGSDPLTPLNLEITRAMEERVGIESELHRQRSLLESETDSQAFESLSRTLLELFEEKMEIKGSLVELRDLNAHNETEIVKLRERMRDGQRLLLEGDLPQDEADRVHTDVQAALDEIANIERNTRENESIRAQLESDLKRTEDSKADLQNQILKLKVGNRRSFMALQVQVHELKLENVDLETKNLHLQKELLISQGDVTKLQERNNHLETELRRLRLLVSAAGHSSPRSSLTTGSSRTPSSSSRTTESQRQKSRSDLSSRRSDARPSTANPSSSSRTSMSETQRPMSSSGVRRPPSKRPAVVPPLPLDSSGLLIGKKSSSSKEPRKSNSARGNSSRTKTDSRRTYSARPAYDQPSTSPRTRDQAYASSISQRAAAQRASNNSSPYSRQLSPRRTGTHGTGARDPTSPRRSSRNVSPARSSYPANSSTNTSTSIALDPPRSSGRVDSPRSQSGFRSPRKTPREKEESRVWEANVLASAQDIQRQLAERPPTRRLSLTPRGGARDPEAPNPSAAQELSPPPAPRGDRRSSVGQRSPNTANSSPPGPSSSAFAPSRASPGRKSSDAKAPSKRRGSSPHTSPPGPGASPGPPVVEVSLQSLGVSASGRTAGSQPGASEASRSEPQSPPAKWERSRSSSVRVVTSARSPRKKGPKLDTLMSQLRQDMTANGIEKSATAVGKTSHSRADRSQSLGSSNEPQKSSSPTAPPPGSSADPKRAPPRTLQELQVMNEELLQRLRRASVGSNPSPTPANGRDRTVSEPVLSITPRSENSSPAARYEEALASGWKRSR